MKRIFSVLRGCWLVAALVAFAPLGASAQLTPDWVVSTPNTYGEMIALDRGNNAYVVGSGTAPMVVMITKYSPAGAQLWQRTFDNPVTQETGSWVTVDGSGNVIVTGNTVDASGNPNGLVVLKYDSAGNLLWKDVIAASLGRTLRAMSDGLGNAYVLGSMSLTNAGIATEEIVTIKYTPQGTRQWTRNLGAHTATGAPASMAITSAGNVIVAGGAGGTMSMAAYDPPGNQIWSKTVLGSSALDLAIAPSGDFYVVGGTTAQSATVTATDGAIGALGDFSTGPFPTLRVYLVVKHDARFNEVWRRTYDVGSTAMRAAVDSAGNVVITGVYTSLYNSYSNWNTIKLDPTGKLLWTQVYDQHSNNHEIPYSMALGSDNSVYITGQGGPAPADPSGDLSLLSAVTVRYAPDGTQFWAANAPVSVRGLGVKLGTDGGVLVVGESPQTVFRYAQSGLVNQPPIAKASANTSAGPAPLSVNFSSVDSADPDGSIAGYAWAFGDGQTSTAANPSHTYAVGSYTARLTVTDNLGVASTPAEIAITANASAPPPAQPTSLTLARSVVSGGNSTTATVAVSSNAGVTLALSSSNTAVARVPATVVIPAGATRATFTITTSKVRRDTSVTLKATANRATASTLLTVRSK